MRIRSVEYAGTVARPGQSLPGDLPQIAFSGRSNVGKSSLINTLLRRSRNKLAHVSTTPGKTQALNFYRVNDEFFLVDLPGYGYARGPASMRDAWRRLVEWYLERSGLVRGVVHLVDARRTPTEHDVSLMDYLSHVGLPSLVVLTKMDKLNRSERAQAIARVAEALDMHEKRLLPFSSRSGEGREDLLAALEDLLVRGETPRRGTP